jgi:CheY-like chemotaxis protein
MSERTVLVVEDDPEIRETLADALGDEGYRVVLASNGRDALAELPGIRGRFVVVLDLIMPIMNGRDFYEAMRRDPRFAQTPVVVSTSDPSRAPSGVPTLKKPVSLSTLMSTVGSFFENPGRGGGDSGSESQTVPADEGVEGGSAPSLRHQGRSLKRRARPRREPGLALPAGTI